MKKVAFVLVFTALVSAHAYAAGAPGEISFDLSGNWASEPSSGFDDTFGVELGANVDLKRLGMHIDSKTFDVQGRVSLSYYNWDQSVPGNTLDYTRIPLFVGARALTSLSPQIKLYGQLGLELSFDDKDTMDYFFRKQSNSEVNFGITPGIGLLFPITNQVYAGIGLDYHIISDGYATLGLTLGFSLP